jgi:hypothetical protein
MTYLLNCPIPPFNPRQFVFFVMSSRRANAVVVSAHIGRTDADREARRMGSCVRGGYVNDGKAVTL